MSHLIPLPAPPLVAETVHVLVRAVRVALPHARARRTTRPPEKLRKPEAPVPPDDMCMRFPSVLCVRGHFMC